MIRIARSVLASLALVLSLGTVAGAQRASSDGTLSVHVAPLRDAHGVVRVALYDRDATWLSQNAERACVVDARLGDTECDFGTVPAGRYAIAVLHDEDADGQMDYDWIGIPSEGYGFSNDAPVIFSAPGFGSAAFDHAGDQTLRVHARYGL
jgi:uncharacterized protein (DUF2141 family)